MRTPRFVPTKMSDRSDKHIISITKDEYETNLFNVEFNNGSSYKGEIEENKCQGKGQMCYGDGETYEGYFVNNRRDGHGKYEWEDGSIQVGEWKNDLMYGQGEHFIASTGDYYCGNFVDDKYNGTGTLIYGNLSKYEGEWLDDKRCGKGKMTDSNGNVYVGDWQNDKKHGQGIFKWADEKEYYDGEWQKGDMSGYGAYHYACGNHYQGEMRKNEEHGIGHMKYKNGNEFRGEFNMGTIIQGIMCYENGDVYEGEFDSHSSYDYPKPHGKGQMDYWNENSTYNGEWNQGKRHGQGTLYIMNDDHYDDSGNRIAPKQYSGQWQNNLYYEPVWQLLNEVNRHIACENPGRIRMSMR